MNAAPKIALFGGSFDPIHEGHVEVARTAIDQLGLDEVRFIPCRISPHKLGQPPASADDRLAMLRLALDGKPWAVVDERELTQPPPSYSYRTAEQIQGECPDARLFWLLGTDQWESLPRWKEPEKLAAMLEFIVFRRGPAPKPRNGWRMTSIEGAHPASSSAIREEARNGHVPTDWLHPEVARYIEEHRLYQG